jgi:NAD(P)-dependent dehydrogenase (short-subunit alcohol dehydrogenase family)
VLQNLDPRLWPSHRFGLPLERWQRLRGRSYWITGSGTGFGQALAVALACAGARVFLTGRRPNKLTATIAEARRLGGADVSCRAVPADITDAQQVSQAFAIIAQECEALDGLVNNAAWPQRRSYPWPLQQESANAWQQLLEINVTAPWRVTAAALPHLVKGGALRVLFVSSEAGWAFTAGVGQYNVTKAALNNLAASFGHECAARYPGLDVQINGVVPGEARTEMNQGSERSPYAAVCMMLLLLSHPPGGPNARFFHADGRHLAFAYAPPFERSLLDDTDSRCTRSIRGGKTLCQTSA